MREPPSHTSTLALRIRQVDVDEGLGQAAICSTRLLEWVLVSLHAAIARELHRKPHAHAALAQNRWHNSAYPFV
jgi:hypothetical protein